MKLIYILLLAITPFITQCSSDSESYTEPDIYSQDYTPYQAPKAKSDLDKALFYCSANGECPNNVGLIQIKKSFSLSQCTGFLIADNIVATNKHCIPDYIQHTGADCSNNLSIRFLAPKQDQQTFKCKKIINVFQSNEKRLIDFDYAFFEIDSTNITPFSISKKGVSNNADLKTYRVTPLGQGQIGGRLETSICKSSSQNIINLSGPSRWSNLGLAMGCETVSGNSGSPVLNERNEVVGILQAVATDKYKLLLEDAFKKFKLSVPDKLPKHGLFSNLSCIKDPVTNTYNREKCDFWKSKNIFSCLDPNNEGTKKSITEITKGWSDQLPEVFAYHYIDDKKTGMYTARPFCVKTKEQQSNYSEYVKLKGFIGLRKENINVTFDNVIKVGAQFQVGDDYSLDQSLDITEEFRGSNTLNLTKDGALWEGHGNINSQNIIITKTKLTDLKIPTKIPNCSDEDLITAENNPDKHIFVQDEGKTILRSEYRLKKGKAKKREVLNCNE